MDIQYHIWDHFTVLSIMGLLFFVRCRIQETGQFSLSSDGKNVVYQRTVINRGWYENDADQSDHEQQEVVNIPTETGETWD